MRYARRAGRGRTAGSPSRQWTELSTRWQHTAVAVTTSTVLWGLESPAAAAALTALPPEDVVIMRLVGDFQVALPAAVIDSWTLALTVQDSTWTPAALFNTDADKRILWSQTYAKGPPGEAVTWTPPGLLSTATATLGVAPRESIHIDIAPKVKLEAGQGLNLVAYENLPGVAGTFTTIGYTVRMLWQAKRRS